MPLHISLVSERYQTFDILQKRTDQFVIYVVIETQIKFIKVGKTDEISKAQKKCILLRVVHLGGGGGSGGDDDCDGGG